MLVLFLYIFFNELKIFYLFDVRSTPDRQRAPLLYYLPRDRGSVLMAPRGAEGGPRPYRPRGRDRRPYRLPKVRG